MKKNVKKCGLFRENDSEFKTFEKQNHWHRGTSHYEGQ